MHSRALITSTPPDLAAEVREAVTIAKLRGLPCSHLTLGPAKQAAFVEMLVSDCPEVLTSAPNQSEICIQQWEGLSIRTSDLPGLYVDGGEQLAEPTPKP